MKQEAFKRIGHLYPKVKDENGEEHTVIAWIWARTVKCPNPACGCEMPLAHSFYLSKKKGNETWVEPICENGKTKFVIHKGGKPEIDGTVNRKGATCICCQTPIEFPYIRDCGKKHLMSSIPVVIVAEGDNGRLYLPFDSNQAEIATVTRPDIVPEAALPKNPRDFKTPNYGLTDYSDLFTNRQLTALTTFSALVSEAQKKAEQDAIAAGMDNDETPLAEGGKGAKAYGEAVGVYLAFVVDKLTDYHSSICSWNSPGEKLRNTFGRQAIPMVWDFAECNFFSDSSGSYNNMIDWVYRAIYNLPKTSTQKSLVKQFDAQSDCELRDIMISTDPPYYDNIGYADLSDFFYIWMRQCLRNTYPKVFRTMLVPKVEELIATPYRHEGNVHIARDFFENGMLSTCKQIYKYSRDDIPVTIYYAYKQSDTDSENNQTASTGWETMLSAIINAGFTITGTWPMRTEMSARQIASGTNALASSIVLVCRKRPEDAPSITRRNFVAELKRELKPALHKLQSSNIAPVDLAQSAIGPGMGVFSKYKSVLEADGTPMTVRSALQIINQELDIYFNEQDDELDKESRFCVDLYTQFAFNELKFGDADTLARAKNTSVDHMKNEGIVFAEKGVVKLISRDEINLKVDENDRMVWRLTQQLTKIFEKDGVQGCAKEIYGFANNTPEMAKSLAYRLYTIAERKGWNDDAYAYNNLVTAWSDIISAAADIQSRDVVQVTFF